MNKPIEIHNGLSKREFAAVSMARLLEKQDQMFLDPNSLSADDFPTNHHFCNGVYTRELLVPARTFLIGRTHKTKHTNIFISGAVNVIADGKINPLRAPMIMESEPGLKRAGYVLSDMLWATVHQTQETDLDKVESELFYSFEEEKELAYNELKKLNLLDVGIRWVDNLDYEKMLLEYGMKERDVQKVVQRIEDRKNTLPGCFEIKPSKINGVGIFAKEEIRSKKFTARTKDGKRTDIGRYTNHSTRPNGVMEQQGKSIVLNIDKAEKGEEITINYRKSLELAEIMRNP